VLARVRVAACQRIPEARFFLGKADIVGAHDGVEVAREIGALELELQYARMRVGHQQHVPAAGTHLVEELEHVRVHRDQMCDLALERDDIQFELGAPVVKAVPRQRAFGSPEPAGDVGAGLLLGQAVALAETPRQVLLPEVRVEVEIEQRAVHVQHHLFDATPVEHTRHSVVAPASRESPVNTPAALLDDVLALAERAAASILEVYAAPFETERKSDGTPVTLADKRADRLIREGLRDIATDIPIISEETPPPALAERRSWRRLWLGDPLDGTREFVRRSDEFTVNIALVEDGSPTLGVVLAPVSGVAWYAASGAGAWRREAGVAARRVHSRACPQRPVVAASRSRRNELVNEFLRNLGVDEPMRVGSSIKTCLVAEGAADVYPGFSQTSEWDTAAAQCVLEEAGGRMTDLRMRPLRYNRGDGLDNPRFLAVGDTGRDWSRLLPERLR